ncbi:hypothetical protein NEPAR04_2414 [Nematocida parisii]|nr:hypothetical protein NEPAR08_2411 [Nematocida parisii]KAI5131275.1 hypothetical protein NEPAR03_2372 [Nematocida parisii]KAI5145305.1 hypothetical protein NEPAR04_2414 [Nematocida parisii]
MDIDVLTAKKTNMFTLNIINHSAKQMAAALIKIFNGKHISARTNNRMDWEFYSYEIEVKELWTCDKFFELLNGILDMILILYLFLSIMVALLLGYIAFIKIISYFDINRTMIYYLKLFINTPLLISTIAIAVYFIIEIQKNLIIPLWWLCKSPIHILPIMYALLILIFLVIYILMMTAWKFICMNIHECGVMYNKLLTLMIFIILYYFAVLEIINIITNSTNNRSIIEVVIGVDLTVMLMASTVSLLCYAKMQPQNFNTVLHS